MVHVLEKMEAEWADTGEAPNPRARVTDPDAMLEFAGAGNAYFTLQGRSGRFTYRMSLADSGKLYFVSLLSGSDNNSDYSYLGIVPVEAQGMFQLTKKSRAGEDAPSVKAFTWFWTALVVATNRKADPAGRERCTRLLGQVEFWHEGRCGRCGRRLTVPESVERGIGPECAGKLGTRDVAPSNERTAAAMNSSGAFRPFTVVPGKTAKTRPVRRAPVQTSEW